MKCGVTMYKNKINTVSDEINSMTSNDHTVTQSEATSQRVQGKPWSQSTSRCYTLGPDYARQSTVCKSENQKCGNNQPASS